ncbi:Thioredoxin [uncultured Defluviicoccus sp.]|uniref:Thioredoxin n=1 Tax=metagenome TaxID=256318 RepID=A0A380T7H9_9ZZZZ|nr:Thioredoxin [uncultured Defluviicoccus sp.]
MLKQSVCPSCGAVNRIAAGRDVSAAKCGRCANSLELDHPIEVDDEALANHLKQEGAVLVDVWAEWCGPCRAMAPNFAAAAKVLRGQVRSLKLNADKSATARHIGVSSIPALLLFRDGRMIARTAGLIRPDALVEWVRRHLGTPAEFQRT